MEARCAILAALLGAACATGASRWREPRDGEAPSAAATLVADGGPEPAVMPRLGPDAEPLERRLAQAHSARGRGRPAATPMARGHLGAGQEQGFTLRLEAGACYTLLAVGGADEEDVDLVVFDADGEAVAEDFGRGAVAVAELCPEADAAFRAVVRMYGAPGGFAFQVFGS